MNGAALKLSIPMLICLVALPAVAGEGRIPVWQYPTTINAPGKYIVTRNITGGGGIPIITIAATDVDLDINGFTLDQTAAGGAPVILISGNPDTLDVDVVIRNGILLNGTQSILRDASTGQAGDRVVIEDIQSRSATRSAIHLWSINEVVVRRANIMWPGEHGIWLERPIPPGGFTNGMIEHCAIRSAAGSWDGIHIDRGSSFAVRHNRIETPSLHGIHCMVCYAALVGENTISDADGNGVFFEQVNGGKIYNNVISRGETNGIMVDVGSWGNLVLDNVARQCGLGGAPAHPGAGGNGIVIDGDYNHLEENTTIDSDGCGLLLNGNNNTYGRNMSRGNDPTGSFCTACFALFPPDSCDNGAANDTFGDNLIPGPPIF
jgi:hypothetical protein